MQSSARARGGVLPFACDLELASGLTTLVLGRHVPMARAGHRPDHSISSHGHRMAHSRCCSPIRCARGTVRSWAQAFGGARQRRSPLAGQQAPMWARRAHDVCRHAAVCNFAVHAPFVAGVRVARVPFILRNVVSIVGLLAGSRSLSSVSILYGSLTLVQGHQHGVRTR